MVMWGALGPLSEHFKRGGCHLRFCGGSRFFLAGAHGELSMASIKCQWPVYFGYANLMARAAGRQVSPGAEVPSEDLRRGVGHIAVRTGEVE